jgi:WD40 repeat protein
MTTKITIGKYISLPSCDFITFYFAEQPSSKNKKGSFDTKKNEIFEIKYSPNGEVVAISCKDNLIHILSISNSIRSPFFSFKHLSVCRGHTAVVRNIDFSIDGKTIQSVDAARELLYWDVASGQRLNVSLIPRIRDLEWHTWTCIYGWPVQGIFTSSVSEVGKPSIIGDINCVCRSPDGLFLVTGGSQTVKNVIKLFRFPCLMGSVPRTSGGHTSPVLDIAFLQMQAPTEEKKYDVVSAGGNDCCIFQWSVKKV